MAGMTRKPHVIAAPASMLDSWRHSVQCSQCLGLPLPRPTYPGTALLCWTMRRQHLQHAVAGVLRVAGMARKPPVIAASASMLAALGPGLPVRGSEAFRPAHPVTSFMQP